MDNVPAFTITPLSVCAGGSITLSAAIGNLGADVDLHYYTGGDGSGELGSLSVTPPVTTTYFVQGVSSITGFQSNMKTLVVTVNPLPSLTLSSTNERICAGGSLDLSTLVSAYSDGTLHYYSDAGCTSALGSGMITTPGSYFVRVENTATGCKSAAQEITLTIDPLPVPGITPLRATVYTGEAISYTTDDNKNSYSWNVTNGSVTGSTATRTAGVTWGSAGTGQLTVSYTDPSTGCTGSTSLHVSVVAQGSPVITGSNSVCRGVTGEVYSTDPGKESYEWDITGDGSFTGQGTNSILVNWTSANQTGNRVSVRYKSTLGSPYTGTTNYPVEVKQAPAVGNISVPALSCEGGTLSLPAPTVTTQGSALTAQEGWLLDNQAVTLPHTLSASDHNKKLKYYATCDCSLTGYSNEVTLNVGSVPTVAAITAPNPVCAGLDLGLTAPMVTMNVAPVTQEGWMLGGQKITDPYQPAYADNNKELKYYAETAGCGTGYSNTFNITVYDKPVITGAPVSAQEVCENSLLSLPTPTVDYRGNTASQAAYWTLDGSPVDLSGYRFQSSDNNKKLCYYAQNSCSSTTSSQVTVTVNTLPQPVINPSNNLVYVGDVIPYTTDGGKNAYSWSVTNASITGNTTQSPTITWNTPGAASASVGYTDPATGCTGNTTLNVTVQTISDPPLTGPAYACKDETGLVYSTKPGQYSYDWTITGGTITSGSGTDQITVSWTSASRTGNKVSVRYQPTDISGWSPTTEYQVEVKQAPVVGNISVPALSCVGGTLSLPAPTVTAQGSALTAQEGWLLDNQPITLPHTLSASDHNKKLKYYATCDCNLTSYSNEETLNVGSAPTVGAIAAPGAVCSGTALSLSAPAVTENVAPVMQEGWMLGGQKITAPYQPAYADDTKELKYYAETAGCGTGYSTNTVNITVYDKPVITGAPTSAQQVCENSLLSLSTPTVDYRGNTASQAAYWTLNGVQIDLTSYAFQLSDNGKTLIYNAQNGCGLTTTTGVKVSVHALPVIPLNHNKSNDGTCMNTPVTFTTTSGQSGYTWNWTQGGASLTGGTTGNTLILNWNTPGPKTVEVNYTDANGCTAAAPSSTNVLINPTPVAGDFQNIILCSGSNSGTIQPTGGTDVSSYTWTGGAAAGLADNTTTLNLTSIPGFTASGVSAQIKPTVSIIPYHTNGSTTCSGSTVSFNITVNPLPLPTLSGLETAAKGQGNVVYTTESGQSNYTWSITGGTITSGGGTNSANYTATVTWDSGTNGTISVTYSSPENCPAANPAKKTVTLTDQNAAGISGTTTVCPTPGNRYTYTTQDNKFNYDWTVTGGTVTSGGDGYNTVTVEWSPSTPGSVAVSYRHENNPGLPPVDATQNITKQTVTSIATHPQGSTVCYNNTVNLSVTALSEGTPSYAWEKDGTTTVGTNSNSYIAIESGSYTVVVTGTCGSATSNVASVTVKPQPVATLSGSMTAYATQEVTYTAEAGNSGYNWNYTGATPVSGGSASDNTITVQWATTGTKTISVNYTKDGCPTTTANQDVTVNPQATPVINNPVTTVCYNTPHSYNTQAGKFKYTWTVTGGTVDSGQGTADATILWGSAGPGTIKVAYSETSSSTPVESQVTNITVNDKPSIAALIAPGGVCDNTSLTLTPPVVTSIPSATSQGWNLDGAGFTSGSMVAFAQHNKELYYEATNDCGTTQSDTVKITVYELPTVTAADQSICPGTQIDLSTAVVNLNGHALEFYVQITGGTALAGATVTPAASTTHYVTAVSSDNCTSASRVAIGITVKPVTSITVQPVAPSTVGIGNPFSLSVTAAGDNRSYQWYKDGLSILGNATATASTLTVPSTTPTDYGVYYVVVTGDCGNPVQSAGVTVDILSSDATLKDLQVNGTSLPDFDPQITEYIYTVLCDVDLADITGIPNHSSARVVNLTNQRLEPGDNVYSLTVTAENGFTQKTYTVKIVRDCYIPKITKELEDAIICIGESHTFQVLAEGHNLTYEWYYGNNRILGANSNTYTVTNAKLKDYERYYVIIRSNFNGYKASVYSKNVRLWVADNLPETLLFSDYPSPVARTGRTYHIQLAGYSDVTKYSWSYSKEGVIFSPETGGVGENETWATFGTLSEGIGTLTATLEHPCGTRQASQTIEVKYPLGNDDVTETTVRVSPNPTSGLINVSGTQANRTIRITDVTGSIKGYYQAQEGTTTLDLTAYAKGTYLLLYNGKMFKVIRK
ncbi:hypothetical protein FACS1894155_08220 [Bacteroidia bacterium]|nr:hypothetical protein FACS1894155_08220 [Bacteroidia bacterium]